MAFQSRGCSTFCSTVINGVRVADNMNLTESKFKKFRKNNVRDILSYPSLPDLINRDIFTIFPYLFEPDVIKGRLLRSKFIRNS